MNILIVISGIFGIIGIVEITKGAKLHEFNILHVKFNHLFFDEVLEFQAGKISSTESMERYLLKIREQPIDCLEIAGWLEQFFMKMAGTYGAIELCHQDLALADRTLDSLHNYHSGLLTAEQLSTTLGQSVIQFRQNSTEFEPLVTSTVRVISILLIGMVISKSVLVVLVGIGINKSIRKDYEELAQTQESLSVSGERYELMAKGGYLGLGRCQW